MLRRAHGRSGFTPADDHSGSGTTGKAQKLAAIVPGTSTPWTIAEAGTESGISAGCRMCRFWLVPDLPALSASAPTAAVGVTSVPRPDRAICGMCTACDCSRTPCRCIHLPAPRLTPDDYALKWAPSVQTILDYLRKNNIREIQFVAAFPLPQDLDAAAAAENPSSAVLAQDIHDVIRARCRRTSPAAQTSRRRIRVSRLRFCNSAYPWLKTTGSNVLNESLEPPDGALVGILARNALTRGAFMDATKIVPSEISDLWPQLPAQETCSAR